MYIRRLFLSGSSLSFYSPSKMMSTAQIYQEFQRSRGICTDTRQEVESKIFFALRGEQFDGNLYVEEALEKGCLLAISDREDLKGRAGTVVVPSVLQQLQELAHLHRMELAPRLIAITGSNGKTTTKELMGKVLSTRFRVLATRGNLNNHIGVPLTLLGLRDEEFAVVEMGANHAGEIAKLAGIAAPDVGLITNVGKAHLEGFGSLQGVLEAKSELYAYLAARGGRGIVDGRDRLLLDRARKLGLAVKVAGPGGDLPVEVKLLGQSPWLELELVLGKERFQVNSRLVGAYNLQNILLASAAGLHFGIPKESIAAAIGSYTPENQRSQLLEGGGNKVVLDSYNANPSSMREAIGGLVSYATQPTMLILGDMAELGDDSLDEHRKLVQWIVTLGVDRILLAGPQFYQVSEPSERMLVFRERKDLEAWLERENPRGFQILLKGSRIMELERLAPLLVG
jgi:UDP-N-acetylmuramoyl-tripeptide--D-alanyl-D-alanine ligase